MRGTSIAAASVIPGTMGLLLLAVFFIAWRRRRQRAFSMEPSARSPAAPGTARLGCGPPRRESTLLLDVDEIGGGRSSAFVAVLGRDAIETTVLLRDGFTIGCYGRCDLQLTGRGPAPRRVRFVRHLAGYSVEWRNKRGEMESQVLADGGRLVVAGHELLFKVAARTQRAAPVRLEVRDGVDRGRGLALPERSAVVVGSHESCDLLVRGDGVERRHVVAYRTGQTCAVSDLGTRRGFCVAGRPVGSAHLRPGESFRIGRVRLLYVNLDT